MSGPIRQKPAVFEARIGFLLRNAVSGGDVLETSDGLDKLFNEM